MTSPDCRPGPLLEKLRNKSRSRREALARQADADHNVRLRNDLLPRLELVERPLDELKPPARNVRKADPAHVREVANSIATFGVCSPILVGQDGRVIDGWVVVEAARLRGLTRVPCLVVDHLTALEARALRLALNRLQEKGGWDFAELRIELQELIIEDAPIEITGFSPLELDQITLDDEPTSVEAGPLEPEPGAEAIAKAGDLFRLGAHLVICGDARDPAVHARLMDADEARLVLTDVPYNVKIRGHVTKGEHREFAMASGEMSREEFLALNEGWIDAAIAHLVEGGILGTFIDWRGYPTVHAAAEGRGLTALNLLVWAKTNAGMGSLYRSAHELLPLYKKGTAPHVNNVELGRHGRWRSNVWRYPGASSLGSDARKGLKLHPTVKPVAMLEDALLDLTNRGDIALDPFLGSGSTLIAAEKTGRVCRGIELDPLYVDVIVRRYEAVTGKKAELIWCDESGPDDSKLTSPAKP